MIGLARASVARQRKDVAMLAQAFQADMAFASVKLPAGCFLFASIDASHGVTPAVAAGSRVVSCPAGGAGSLHSLGFFEAGTTLTPAPGAAGNVTIYALGTADVSTKIAGNAVWTVNSPWRKAGDWGPGAFP